MVLRKLALPTALAVALAGCGADGPPIQPGADESPEPGVIDAGNVQIEIAEDPGDGESITQVSETE